MSDNSPDSDPILKSLCDEGAGLSVRAAVEARKHFAQRRRRRIHAMTVGKIVATALLGWRGLYLLSPHSPEPDQASNTRLPAGNSVSKGFVKIRSEEEARNTTPTVPSGITEDQRKVIAMARGLPFLIEMDDTGKIARICIIER